MSPDPTTSDRPRRRRRWWLRVPIILVAFVVCLVVFVQLFLWTDYPRQIAQSQVRRILGVNVSIRDVSVGWFGQTRIEGVTLTLPMETEPFATVDRIDADHTALPLLAFSQTVTSVNVQGVMLSLRQQTTGRWNVESLVPPASNDTSAGSTGNPLAALPDISLTDARVDLIRQDGRQLQVNDVTAQVRRSDAMTAALTVGVAGWLDLSGDIGLTRSAPHSVRIQVTSLPPAVQAFAGIDPTLAVGVDATWQGRRTTQGMAGVLELASLKASELDVAGRLEIDAGPDVVIAPRDLTVHAASVATLALNNGLVQIGNSIKLDRLAGTLNGGRLALDGDLSLSTLASDIDVIWEEVARQDVRSSGSLSVKTSRSLGGRLMIESAAAVSVKTPGGIAQVKARATGEGASLEAFAATLQIEPLTWTTTQGLQRSVPAIVADLAGEGRSLRINQARFVDDTQGQIALYGEIELDRRNWWLTADATALRLDILGDVGVRSPLDLGVAAAGTFARADLTRLYARLDRGTVWARGSYDTIEPRPLNLETWAWYERPVTEDETAQLNALRAVGVIQGTLAPRDLEANADVFGSELVVGGRPLGDVTVRVNAQLGADQASLRSEELELLQGRWMLRGEWSRGSGRPPQVALTFRDIPAERVGAMLEQEGWTGKIDRGVATLQIHSGRLDELEMTGRLSGSSLKAGVFGAEVLEAEFSLDDGAFVVSPTLWQGAGEIQARASGRIKGGGPIELAATLTDWPAPPLRRARKGVDAEQFEPVLSGQASATLEASTQTFDAEVDLKGRLLRDGTSLADYVLRASASRERVVIEAMDISTLDGELHGSGEFFLRDLQASTFEMNFDRLTPSRLAWLNPVIQDVQGTFDGRLSIHPATTPRPLGAMQIDLNVTPQTASFRGVSVGEMRLTAFADVELPGNFRFVTEQAQIDVADGTIEPFVRLTRSTSRGSSQLVSASFEGLDLTQLVRAVDDDGVDVTGRVAGTVRLYGPATSLEALNGEATMSLTQSDLANFGPIAALYDALSIGREGNEPNGSGRVVLRVAGGVLNIDDASYFNRGVYASGFGSVSEIGKLPESPLDLIVAGSLQPLRAVELPFFGDLNDTLAALQSSVMTIHATGTVKSPVASQVAINRLGENLQKILLGKVRGQD
jgi:hypothetical protein